MSHVEGLHFSVKLVHALRVLHFSAFIANGFVLTHDCIYASQEPVKYYNCEFHTDTNYIDTVYVILYL